MLPAATTTAGVCPGMSERNPRQALSPAGPGPARRRLTSGRRGRRSTSCNERTIRRRATQSRRPPQAQRHRVDESEHAEGLRERLGLPQELTWESALGKLHRTGGKLRELRDKGFVRVQRVLGNASTRLPPTPLGALCGVADTFPLTAENVLLGYAQGLFAMDIDGKVRWHCPPERFIVYLSELRISSNMRRELKRASYTTTFDRAPREVLDACAAERRREAPPG